MIDISSFTGQIQVIEAGVRTKNKHVCFNYDSGATKTTYNKDQAVKYCKRYWKGCTWDIHEVNGKVSKKVAESS